MLEPDDKRIKYRNFRFRKELEKARQYKRSPRQMPETNLEILLARLGLDTWQKKAVLCAATLAAAYLVWFPNFLSIKSYEIAGPGLSKEAFHRQATDLYLKSSRLWPQNNLLLLSRQGLKTRLEAEPWVLSVEEISKKWPNNLKIRLKERSEFALVQTPQASMVFSNDGKWLETVASSSAVSEKNLLSIKTPVELGPQNRLEQSGLDLISLIMAKLPEISQTSAVEYVIYPGLGPDLEVLTSAGYKIIFDSTQNNQETLANLAVLFGKLPGEEKNRLAYIDLRIKNKAYTCLKGTECVLPTLIKAPGSSQADSATSASSTLIVPK